MEDLKFKTASDVMQFSNSKKDEAFQCNNNSNFQMDVNGFRISVAFGPGMYVNDRDIRYKSDYDTPMTFRVWGTDSAEVMIWDRDGNPMSGITVIQLLGFVHLILLLGLLVVWLIGVMMIHHREL
jgi:hypothetical protein